MSDLFNGDLVFVITNEGIPKRYYPSYILEDDSFEVENLASSVTKKNQLHNFCRPVKAVDNFTKSHTKRKSLKVTQVEKYVLCLISYVKQIQNDQLLTLVRTTVIDKQLASSS